LVRAWGTICAVLALFVAGCGDGSDSVATIGYRPWNLPLPDRQIRRAEALKPSENGLVGSELKPIIPDRPPPEFLVAVDLIDGIGTPAYEGDQVTVQYVGAVYGSKEKFASSWDEGKPFNFTLGKGEAIQGWEEGIEGMEISDRRELVVPPELVTGGTRMKALPSASALVFVVELLEVNGRQ